MKKKYTTPKVEYYGLVEEFTKTIDLPYEELEFDAAKNIQKYLSFQRMDSMSTQQKMVIPGNPNYGGSGSIVP